MKTGLKCDLPANVMYFMRPFRPDMYRRHLTTLQGEPWKNYAGLSDEENARFFVENAPVVHHSTVKWNFGGSQTSVTFFVDKNIVDCIFDKLLF